MLVSLLPDKLDFVFNTEVIYGSYSVGDSECGTLNVGALSDNLVERTFTASLYKLDTSVTIFIIDNDCK